MKKQSFITWLLALVLTTATGLEALAQGGVNTGKNLAGSASLSPNHTKLLALLKVAGLDSKAAEAGPYTVFAPTNDAFNKLSSGTMDNLMKPTGRQRLTQILTYHVVPGTLIAADLQEGQQLKTVNGGTLTVSKQGGTVTVKDAKGGVATVTTADIKADNGIVHIVDTVLMP